MSDVQLLATIMGIGSTLISITGAIYGQKVLNAVNDARDTREQIKDIITKKFEDLTSEISTLELQTSMKCVNLEVRTEALERDVKQLKTVRH